MIFSNERTKHCFFLCAIKNDLSLWLDISAPGFTCWSCLIAAKVITINSSRKIILQCFQHTFFYCSNRSVFSRCFLHNTTANIHITELELIKFRTHYRMQITFRLYKNFGYFYRMLYAATPTKALFTFIHTHTHRFINPNNFFFSKKLTL